MKPLKRILSLALASTLCLTTCLTAAASSAEYDGCLNIAIPADPADLSPFTTASMGRVYVMDAVYEYLACYEEKNGEFKGQLAKEWTLSDDALTLTVTIWDNIYDSQGNHLTANDVEFSIQSAVDAQSTVTLGYLDSMEVVDDYTLIFNLNSAIVEGWQGVMSAVPIVTEAAYTNPDNNFAVSPVSTSAYEVTEFIPGSSLHLTKRADYWQTDDSVRSVKSYPDEIEFDVVLESSQMSINLETGRVDIAEGISTTEVTRFQEGGESAEGFTTFSTNDSLVYTLLFNCSEEGGIFYDNQALRQAIAYAIDAEGVLDIVMDGDGTVCDFPGSSYSDDKVDVLDDYYSYNLEKAQELLAEAGYEPGDLTLRFMCNNDTILSSALETIQSYLMAIGIETEINVVDSGLYDSVKYDPSEWDLLVDNIGGKNIAEYAQKWDSTGKSYINAAFAKDDTFQSLNELVTMTPTHTDENVGEWIEYTADQCFFYCLFTKNAYVAAADYIEGVSFSPRSAVIAGDTIIAE